MRTKTLDASGLGAKESLFSDVPFSLSQIALASDRVRGLRLSREWSPRQLQRSCGFPIPAAIGSPDDGICHCKAGQLGGTRFFAWLAAPVPRHDAFEGINYVLGRTVDHSGQTLELSY